MAQTIKLRRSATQGGTPTVSQLSLGEVAINTYDGKMYIKKDSGTASIVEVGGDKLPLTGGTLTGNLSLGDNVRALFGTGNDLQIYHDGSNSYITDSGTGNLKIGGANVVITTAGGTKYFEGASNRAFLFHTGNQKLVTTAYGIDITGNITASGTVDGVDIAARDAILTSTTTTANAALPKAGGTISGHTLFSDNVEARWGNSADLKIYHDGSHSYISDVGTGNLIIKATHLNLRDANNTLYMEALQGGAVTLRHAGNISVATTSTGINVTGSVVTDGLTSAGTILATSSTTISTVLRGGDGNSKNLVFQKTTGSAQQAKISAVGDDLRFTTGTTTERMRIDSSGNIGIGTSAPTSKVDIRSPNGVTHSRGQLYLTNNDTAAINKGSQISLGGTYSGTGDTYFASIAGRKENATSADYDGYLQFATRANGGSNVERMRITSTGNVGIGTTSPGSILEVMTAATTGTQDIARFSRATYGATVTIAREAGDGVVYSPANLTLSADHDNNSVGTNSNIKFKTDATERMRIDASGRVGIGTSNPLDLLYIKSSSTDARLVLDAAAGADPELKFFEAGNVKYTVGHDAATSKFVIGTSNVDTQKRFTINSSGAITFNEAFTFPTADGSTNQVLKTDGSGNMSWASVAVGTPTYLADADGDTKIQVEESSDEDIIRFDAGGEEVARMQQRNNECFFDLVRRGVPAATANLSFSGMGLNTNVTSGYHSLVVQNNGSEQFRVHSNGNVGIGESSPGQKLQVNGNIRADGHYYVGGQIVIDSNRRILAADGAANVPYITFAADTNTGLYRPGADILGFSTAGSERVRIDASGNVGIGTSSPSQPLEVAGNIQATGTRSISALYDSNHYMRLEANSSGGILKGTDGGVITTLVRTYGDSYFNGGNVGIGTTNPTNHINTGSFFKPDSSGKFLTVNGGAHGSFIMLESSTTTDNDQIGGIYWNRTGAQGDAHKQVAGIDVIQDAYAPNNLLEGGTLRFFTKQSGSGTNTPRMVIKDGGYVGIGTTNPIMPLQVAGNIYCNGGDSFIDTGRKLIWGNSTTWVEGNNNTSLEFGVNSAERMRITSTGKVGIGTTAPTEPLTVSETSSGNLMQIASFVNPVGTANTGVRLWLSGTNTTTRGTFIDAVAESTANNHSLRFGTSASSASPAERMRINHDGNVGIGTSAPGAKLHVDGAIVSEGGSFTSINSLATDAGLVIQKNDYIYSDDNEYLRRIIGHTSTGIIEIGQGGTSLITDIILKPGSTGNVRFFASGSEDVRINASGNVGIGTTAPAAKLQVEELGIDTTTTSTTATTQVAIDSMVAATFRSARYTIQVTNSTDGTYHLTEMLLIHNGTTPSINEFGTIFTGSAAEAAFTADINSGNVRILATPASTDAMAFKVVRHSITV